MYRILLFAALFSTVLFTNCKKDKGLEDLIVGKWNATKMIADGDDLIQGDEDYKSRVVIEFTSSGSLIFTITDIDLTVTPAQEETFTIAGTYTVGDDDQLTISLTDGTDTYTATGPAEIKSNHLTFTAVTGAEDFISLLEADKQ